MRIIIAASTVEKERSRRLEYFHIDQVVQEALAFKSPPRMRGGRLIPFSGGPRKCVGDQFALLEAIVSLAIFLQHLNFELVPDWTIGMTTGHTTNVTSDDFYVHLCTSTH